MRGANPDVECPRCGNKQPPTEGLVTCTTCGLGFQPKEIQQRVRRPSRAPSPELPARVPPRSLAVEQAGDAMTLAWNDNAGTGWFAIATGVVFLPIIWTSGLLPGDLRFYTVVLIAFIVLGIYMTRSGTRIALTPARLECKAGSYNFADIAKVAIDGKRVVLTLREGVVFELASSRDRRITQFIADVVNDRVTE